MQHKVVPMQVEQNNDEDDGSSRLEESPRLSQPMPCIKTTSIKTDRWVIFVEDSLLRGEEGPICRLDPLLKEVCCLLGARVKDVK